MRSLADTDEGPGIQRSHQRYDYLLSNQLLRARRPNTFLHSHLRTGILLFQQRLRAWIALNAWRWESCILHVTAGQERKPREGGREADVSVPPINYTVQTLDHGVVSRFMQSSGGMYELPKGPRSHTARAKKLLFLSVSTSAWDVGLLIMHTKTTSFMVKTQILHRYIWTPGTTPGDSC